MSTDHRNVLKAAIERAKARSEDAANQPVAPAAESPHDVMARRLVQQWQDVIAPKLVELNQELEAAGFKTETGLPSEATEGTFQLRVPARDGWWNPGFRVSALQEGSAVSVVATMGVTASNPPMNKVVQPEEITSDFVASLVTELINKGV